MDLNSLAESGTALWAILGTAGGVTFLNVLSFIKITISGKKFSKVSDFAVVADQSIKFAKGEIKEMKKDIVEQTKLQIVEPLKQQVQALVSDNAKLSSLVVSLISYIPLPLEVKKEAVAITGTLGNIMGEAQTLLQSSVDYQQKQESVVVEKSTELLDDIDKI